MGLLEKMQFSIDTMTLGEKLLGSLLVTLLGIGIVFAALATLYVAIVIMQKVVNNIQPKKEVITKPTVIEEPVADEDTVDSEELIAVITAAVATSLHTSTHNIIVRNITRIEDTTPSSLGSTKVFKPTFVIVPGLFAAISLNR